MSSCKVCIVLASHRLFVIASLAPSPTLPASGEGAFLSPRVRGDYRRGIYRPHPCSLPHTRRAEGQAARIGGHRDAALDDLGISLGVVCPLYPFCRQLASL